MENPLWMEVLMGKFTINGPFSMVMLNNQRVLASYIHPCFIYRFTSPPQHRCDKIPVKPVAEVDSRLFG